MESDSKYLLDTGLNTVMMVAFAVPGGAPIGAGLAVVNFLFGWLVPTNPATPGSSPVTQPELKQALDNLKAGIVDATFNSKVNDITNNLLSLFADFQDILKDMGKLKTVSSDTFFAQQMADYFNWRPTISVRTIPGVGRTRYS